MNHVCILFGKVLVGCGVDSLWQKMESRARTQLLCTAAHPWLELGVKTGAGGGGGGAAAHPSLELVAKTGGRTLLPAQNRTAPITIMGTGALEGTLGTGDLIPAG